LNPIDLNNLLVAISIIVAIILFFLVIIIGIISKRKKANKKYFEICGKRTNRVKIKEMLKDRPDYEYYYTREVDNSILDAMKEKKSFVIIGRALAGKTRAVYEAFKKSKKKYSLFKLRPLKINIEDFKIPKNLFFRFRDRMLFIDDIDRFSEQENFDYVLQEAKKNNVIITATCRSGGRGIDKYKKNMNSKNLDYKSHTGEEFNIFDVSDEIAMTIKNKLGVKLKKEEFDGTIGSLFMPLREMADRYEDCSEEEKTILRSIKEMYITGICYGMNLFPQAWVKELSSYNNPTINNTNWNGWIGKLIKTELISVIKSGNYIRTEEVYLEKIINGDYGT